MNKNAQFFRKWWGLLVIGVLLVSSLSGCGAKEKVLKVGYITELTGVDAYVGAGLC
jgi:uncharacterized lipoprotein YehR (DUF1307 family)